MLGPTHRALAVTAATSISVAASASLSAMVVIVWSAWTTARLPDRLEKWTHARHRTWTHWLPVAILTALAVGMLVYGAGTLAAVVAESRMGRDGREFVGVLEQAAVGFGVLVSVGALCGCVMHVLADACTRSGVPLLGPFSRRDRWLFPRSLRTETGRTIMHPDGTVERTWEMSAGERCWFVAAWLATALILVLHFLPELKGTN